MRFAPLAGLHATSTVVAYVSFPSISSEMSRAATVRTESPV